MEWMVVLLCLLVSLQRCFCQLWRLGALRREDSILLIAISHN